MQNAKRYFVLILITSTFLGSIGQLFFKLGVQSTRVSLLIYILVGIISYGISTVLYLHVLGRMHLSWVYGFGGLSYIFVNILAFFVLSEKIATLRWVGIVMIAIGTALIGLS